MKVRIWHMDNFLCDHAIQIDTSNCTESFEAAVSESKASLSVDYTDDLSDPSSHYFYLKRYHTYG